MSRRQRGECDVEGPRHGFGGFLRSLLAGLPWSERAEERETLRIAAAPGRLLRVQNANGRIRVLGEDRDDVEVIATKIGRAESDEAAEALLREIRVLCGVVGGALEVEVDVPRRWNRRGHAHLELRVPRGTSVEVSSSNGKICVENLCGAVRARSSNGSVDVASVVGNIDVSASNAKVLEWQLAPMCDASEQVVALVAVLRDVTTSAVRRPLGTGSDVDPSTGLPNQVHFMSRLERALSEQLGRGS